MPRRDGTGPMGMGSMTGRGAGNCLGYASPEFANRGVGFGRGMGGGRGLDEKAALKNQEDFLEKQLQQVKGRLKDFDNQK